MERQRYPHDPHLTASLKKLKDWKEYQTYFQRRIDKCQKIIEEARRKVEAVERNDPDVYKGTVPGRRGHQYWLDDIERLREQLAPEEKRLNWVKQQLPAVLSECTASLAEMPASRREMEERSELEAKRVFNTLVDTGGRPTRLIQSHIQDGDADEHLSVLCHWEGECSQFEEELREWKKFLDYRQKKEADGKAEVQLEERPSAESPAQVDLWKDYRAYQQLEVGNAKQLVEFWQRQVKYFQQEENSCARQGIEGQAERHHSEAEDTKSHVEDARKQVGPAEARLEWVEEQLSALLAECAVSMTEVSTSDHLEDQAMLPKRASRSGQTTLKNFRSTIRGNQSPYKNKERASVNSALGPIHSSKVSKAVERKTSRPRRPKIRAERGDGRTKGPSNTTISPSSPTNVAPHRSSRLHDKEKKSGTWEASLAVDLGESAHTPPIILRRSDRISKQREGMSTSTSSAVASSVLISRADPSPRRSRSKAKGRLASNKSDMGSAKPRGVSKRQERNFSRKRNRVPGGGGTLSGSGAFQAYTGLS